MFYFFWITKIRKKMKLRCFIQSFFVSLQKNATMQTKSTYRFVSLKEPSLRELSMIMKEVAVEAKEKSQIAEQQFFNDIVKQIRKEC